MKELAFYQQKVGNTYDGIIETRKDHKKVVITSNYIPVEVITDKANNDIVKVKITQVKRDSVYGEIIS